MRSYDIFLYTWFIKLMSSRLLCTDTNKNSLNFCGWIIYLTILYISVNEYMMIVFPFLGYCNASVNTDIQIPLWGASFVSFRYTEVRFLIQIVAQLLNFKELLKMFHNDCSNLYWPQQSTKIPFFSYLFKCHLSPFNWLPS